MAYPNDDDDGHFLDDLPFSMDENEHEENAYLIPNVNNEERVENVAYPGLLNNDEMEELQAGRTWSLIQKLVTERDKATTKAERLNESLVKEKTQTEKRLKTIEMLVNEKINKEAQYLQLRMVAEHEIARCQEETRYQLENASKLQDKVSNLEEELSKLRKENSTLQDELAQSKERVEDQTMNMIGILEEKDALRAENIELKHRLRSPTSADEWNLLETFMKDNEHKEM